LEIRIDDAIGGGWYGGITARDLSAQIKAAGDKIKTIRLIVNSPGGNVFDGFAIYNELREHPATVVAVVRGLAASAATVACSAADKITMESGSFWMIHRSSTFVAGDSEDMLEVAERLEKVDKEIAAIYARRTKDSAEKMLELMSAETWMNAEEAVEAGFADEALSGNEDEVSNRLCGAMIAQIVEPFKNVPTCVAALSQNAMQKEETLMAQDNQVVAATYEEIKSACPAASPAFVCEALEAKLTVAQARDKHVNSLIQAIAAKDAEISRLKGEVDLVKAENAVLAKSQGSGLKPVPETVGAEGQVENYDTLVAKYQSEGLSKAQAIRKVVVNHKEAHEAMLANAKKGRK
jgi:ATP-dependent protease ClpP protease subunit